MSETQRLIMLAPPGAREGWRRTLAAIHTLPEHHHDLCADFDRQLDASIEQWLGELKALDGTVLRGQFEIDMLEQMFNDSPDS